jgi:hypothetical protein
MVRLDPRPATDALVSVEEGGVALAGCLGAGWVVTRVENAIYGSVEARCNSSLSYTCAAAAAHAHAADAA